MSQAVAGSSPVVLPGSVAQRRLPLVVTQVSHTQVRVLPGPRHSPMHSPVSELVRYRTANLVTPVRVRSGLPIQWLVAQRRVRRPPKSTIAGSSPAQPTTTAQAANQWRLWPRLLGGLDASLIDASLAQWIARRSSKPAGLGSSPRRRTMVRWSKRLTHLVLAQETAGSSPARTTQYTRSARTRVRRNANQGPIVYWLGSRTFNPRKTGQNRLGLLRGSQVR